MKDVLRYLETGNLGRLAYKPKDKESIEVELEDDNISVSPLKIEFTKLISLSYHLANFLIIQYLLSIQL
jgi:hypothetical protein